MRRFGRGSSADKACSTQCQQSSGVASGEWLNLQPTDILADLAYAGRFGLVAKNADAFEIIAYGRDTVPEHVGV